MCVRDPRTNWYVAGALLSLDSIGEPAFANIVVSTAWDKAAQGSALEERERERRFERNSSFEATPFAQACGSSIMFVRKQWAYLSAPVLHSEIYSLIHQFDVSSKFPQIPNFVSQLAHEAFSVNPKMD